MKISINLFAFFTTILAYDTKVVVRHTEEEKSYVNVLSVDNLQFKPNEPLKLELNLQVLELTIFNSSIYANSLSLMKDIKYLGVVFSVLNHIEDSAFCSFPGLETLEFSGNFISFPRLTAGMLENCSSLKFIIIELNNSTAVNEWLKIDEDAFGSLQNLEKIHIKHQNFPNLTKKNFQKLVNLKELFVVDSQVKEIDQKLFSNTKKLEIVDLHRNEIKAISGIFWDLPKLEQLHLANNLIEVLSWKDFQNLPSLKLLDVSFNKIVKWEHSQEIAGNLPNLWFFIFRSNPISCKEMQTLMEDLKIQNITEILATSDEDCAILEQK